RDGITVYKEIARRVNATEHSIGRWAKEDNWELYRKNMLLTREEQMQNLLNELAELNEFIKQKPEGKRFANAKEGDVRRKLIKDMKELVTKASLAEIIETSKRMIRWLSPVDLPLAQKLTDLYDQFIKDSLR